METLYKNYSPTYQAVDKRNPWKPGFISRFPVKGLGAVLGALLSVAASASIVVYSNGKEIDTGPWKVFQPTVYIAIAIAIANLFLAFALKEGADIWWWRRATKEKTTIGDLQRQFAYGNGFVSALFSGRHVNLLALACIFTTLAEVNGPLLQRASKVVVATFAANVPVQIRMPTEFRTEFFTGYLSGRGHAVSIYSAAYAPVVLDFNNKLPISIGNDTGCKGSCSATIAGLGLAVNCYTYTVPFNISPQYQPDGTYNVTLDPSVMNGTYVFGSQFSWDSASPTNITLDVLYKPTTACAGNLVGQRCMMHPAVVNYPVVIDGNKSIIALDPSTTIFNDTIQHKINLTATTSAGPTTLGGYYLALFNKHNSSTHLRWVGAVGYELLTTGSTATQYAQVNDTSIDLAVTCSLTFSDPTTDLLASARDLMFRTSIAAANISTPIQQVTAYETTQRTIYRTNYAFLSGGVGATLLAILLVTLIYHGYHELGRGISMSPIEIAKAFNAPILINGDSNATANGLDRELGKRSVRYGATGVLMPVDDGASGFSTGSSRYREDGGAARIILAMADESVVRPPREGERFSG